jgi:asparagine synthase (glutamine-hydrolysing)
MCGIAGVVAAHGTGIEAERLAAMIAMVDHRGPDGRGMHVEPCVGLAHARLSVIDIAGGAQPMSNEDGSLWITFNGEIFNYIELRDDLVARGHRFKSLSDTEVILHLYEEEGSAAVSKLNGQWALGIWDARARTLFLSRDRLGVRPLFYTVCGDRLIFASEVKALFADPRVSREIDPRGLDDIFTFWTTLAPRTIFKDVRELSPGSSLTWHDGRITIEPHWRPTFPPRQDAPASRPDALAPISEGTQRETLQALLTEATRLRLRSDVPVGAYLSGGLDSSLVTALAVGLSAAPVRTFSVSFDDPEFDERRHQQQMVAALGTEHSELRCSGDDIARVFPDVVWHAETPLLRTSPAPLYLLAQMVRDSGYKVVLTGEGADEMFGGYDIFKEAKVRRFSSKFPASTRRASLVKRLYPYLPNLQRQPAASLQTFFDGTRDDPADPCFSHLPRWRVTAGLKRFFSEAIRSAVSSYDGRAQLASRLPPEYADWDPFCQSQYLETAHLLPGYILSSQGDRVAMAHGVEARFPFLDPNVVSFASGLPPALKMKVLNEKYLLKQVARNLIPAPVWQRSKQPYRAPGARALFAAGRHGYTDDLLSSSQLQRDGIFEPSAVERLVRKFRAGTAIGLKDDMALTAIISTQLIVNRFINHFTTVTHGIIGPATANVHHG